MIEELAAIRKQISELEEQEAELVNAIIGKVGHSGICSKTYELDGSKFTIETRENVTLDKNKLNAVWNERMPINRAYAYTLRKADFDAVMEVGTPEQKKFLADIVTIKAGKPSLKLK